MITTQEILEAQNAWGNGVVRLGQLTDEKEPLRLYAESFLNKYYDFKNKDVLFKPTKAAIRQFRPTNEGALSYFIGGNSDYPEDNGFALQPWTKVRFENAILVMEENRAFAMGNYFFTDVKGQETKVEYTFGYYKDLNGNLRIDLHHSSLPFRSAQDEK